LAALGYTESIICARTSYFLLHVLQEHPAMKAINSTNYGINYATEFPASPMVPRIYNALYTTLLDLRLHIARNEALFCQVVSGFRE
jgi:hypothetical protein